MNQSKRLCVVPLSVGGVYLVMRSLFGFHHDDSGRLLTKVDGDPEVER